MLSKTGEYALRAVVALAGVGEGKPVLGPDLAGTTRVPQAYLSKVMRTLVRAGIATSQRGQGGGFALALPADEITVLDVLDAVDPIQRIDTCPLGLRAHAGGLCPLHRRLDEAFSMVQQALGETAISDLTGGDGWHSPLCEPVAAEES